MALPFLSAFFTLVVAETALLINQSIVCTSLPCCVNKYTITGSGSLVVMPASYFLSAHLVQYDSNYAEPKSTWHSSLSVISANLRGTADFCGSLATILSVGGIIQKAVGMFFHEILE